MKKPMPTYQYAGKALSGEMGFQLTEAGKYPLQLDEIIPDGEYYVEIKIFKKEGGD
jgi:hypothetical protein